MTPITPHQPETCTTCRAHIPADTPAFVAGNWVICTACEALASTLRIPPLLTPQTSRHVHRVALSQCGRRLLGDDRCHEPARLVGGVLDTWEVG